MPLACISSCIPYNKNEKIISEYDDYAYDDTDVDELSAKNLCMDNHFAKNGPVDMALSFLGIHGTYIGNTAAVVLGMVYEYLPFMMLPIYTVMSKIDGSMIEAAQDLGSNNGAVFRKVIFPLSMPGVISGITLVFVPSASTFLVSQYLGGTDDIMIGDIIDKIFWTDQNTGSAISLILMIFIFVFLVIMNFFGDEEAIA